MNFIISTLPHSSASHLSESSSTVLCPSISSSPRDARNLLPLPSSQNDRFFLSYVCTILYLWASHNLSPTKPTLIPICTCCTSNPLPHRSVDIKILEFPCLNYSIILSLSFWSIPPCILETVKLFLIISLANHSTLSMLLQNITAWVMVRLS